MLHFCKRNKFLPRKTGRSSLDVVGKQPSQISHTAPAPSQLELWNYGDGSKQAYLGKGKRWSLCTYKRAEEQSEYDQKSDQQCLLELWRVVVFLFFTGNLKTDFSECIKRKKLSNCHARIDNHWYVASTRYIRKMYVELTRGNNLTFIQDSKQGFSWTLQSDLIKYESIMFLEHLAIRQSHTYAHVHKNKWNLLFSTEGLFIAVS